MQSFSVCRRTHDLPKMFVADIRSQRVPTPFIRRIIGKDRFFHFMRGTLPTKTSFTFTRLANKLCHFNLLDLPESACKLFIVLDLPHAIAAIIRPLANVTRQEPPHAANERQKFLHAERARITHMLVSDGEHVGHVALPSPTRAQFRSVAEG